MQIINLIIKKKNVADYKQAIQASFPKFSFFFKRKQIFLCKLLFYSIYGVLSKELLEQSQIIQNTVHKTLIKIKENNRFLEKRYHNIIKLLLF